MSGPRTTVSAAPRLRLNVAFSSWELIWSHVHRVLVVNLGVALTHLPLLVALQLCHQPWRHPLLFAPLLLLTGPSLAAVFAYLDQAGQDGPATVRAFGQAYRRLFRPALRTWGPALLTVLATVADVSMLRTSELGQAVVPMAAVVAVLAFLSGVVALTRPVPTTRAGFRAFVLVPYAVVRHWALALTNLAMLVTGVLLVNQAPVLGLAVLPGCVLFVVWHNCRFMTHFAASTDGPAAVPDSPAGAAAEAGRS